MYRHAREDGRNGHYGHQREGKEGKKRVAMRSPACRHVKFIMVDKNGKYCSSQRCDHCHHADGTVQMHHNYIPVDAATCNRLGISNTSRAYGTRVSWDEQYVSTIHATNKPC